MDQPARRVKALFDEAVEIESPVERAAYLDRECTGAPELRRQVEALLRVHADMGSFLDKPILDPRATVDPHTGPLADAAGGPDLGGKPAVASAPPAEGPGTRIGPYKLLQEIGQGGMGTVFLAEQREPVRRQVALKIIKAELTSDTSVVRFEAERQALALMDHPNIAKVLDAGTTAAGRPYFVMELVKGIPITKYCDDHRLTLRQRLELFVPVCHALQHAHQKGIIHRDLKPSNVLVAPYDGVPVPKVIDFGIAKATGPRLTDKTLFTEFGSVLGTLEYMSPEQAELNNQDIDTRSDVYSLGVLLYELMTGTTPLAAQRLERTAFLEQLRLIREEEPPRPSTRLSSAKESLPAVSAQRQAQPAQLARLVRGELDWIVMKALEKDRARRYETANSLARDVEHYLRDEPVEACPPSAGYKLRKFARKNRRLLVAGAAFVALLVAGVAVSTWLAVRARRAEIAAELDLDRAVAAEGQANTERDRARRSEAEAKAVLNFFAQQVLAAARPEGYAGGLGRNATIRQAVEAAEPKIAAAFADQPLVEASIRFELGHTYRHLGEMPLALAQYQRALELRQPRLPSDHLDMVRSMLLVASCMGEIGQFDRAIQLLEQLLAAQIAKYGPDVTQTNAIRNNLALYLHRIGQSDRSISVFEQLIADHQAKYGPTKPPLLYQSNLGLAYVGGGQGRRAVELLEQTLAGQRSTLGADYPDTLTTQFHLTEAYNVVGQPDRSLPLLEQTLAAQRVKLGPDHIETITSEYRLYTAYHDRGEHARAEPLLRDFLAAAKRQKGVDVAGWLAGLNLADDWSQFHAQVLIGAGLLDQNKYTEAEPLLRTGYEGLRQREARMSAAGKLRLTEALERLVQLYDAWGQKDQAETWRKQLEARKAATRASARPGP
jgi:serine/threonine protein kinase/tetratricopeptide (TPR) repeat protein